MRVETDDEIYAVDNVYLGPPGYTFPWKARYFAYGVFGLLFVFGLLVLHLSTGYGVWPVIFMLLAVLGVTAAIGKRVTPETPARAVPATFLHELMAPRRKTGRRVARPDLTRVRWQSRPGMSMHRRWTGVRTVLGPAPQPRRVRAHRPRTRTVSTRFRASVSPLTRSLFGRRGRSRLRRDRTPTTVQAPQAPWVPQPVYPRWIGPQRSRMAFTGWGLHHLVASRGHRREGEH